MLSIKRKQYGFDYYWNDHYILTSAPRYIILNYGEKNALVFWLGHGGKAWGITSRGKPFKFRHIISALRFWLQT